MTDNFNDDEALTTNEENLLRKDEILPDDEDQDQDQDEGRENTDPDPEFEDFLEGCRNKSPEEMADFATELDKDRRAARQEAAEAQEAQEAQEALRAHQARLGEDTDAAAQQQAERVAAQTALARSAVPDFDNRREELRHFGVARLGYTPEEIAAVDDARDVVTLYMAMAFDQLMRTGVVDAKGRLIQGVRGTAPADSRHVDPRLAMPAAPRTLSSAAGRGSGGATKTLRQQAQEALTMSDEDFGRISGDDLDRMLRELSRG